MSSRSDTSEIVGTITRLLQHRKPEEAMRVLSESGLSSDTADYQILYCAILNAAGNDPRTLATLNKSRLRFPEAWQLVNMQLAVHLRQRDKAAAKDCMSSLLASGAPENIKLYAQVHIAVAEENLDAAVTLLEDSLRECRVTLSADIGRDLFSYHYQLGNYASSLVWLEKALALDPMLDYEAGNLIVILSDLEPHDHGEARLLALRQRFPKNNSLLESMCSLLLMKGNISKLEKLLSESADSDERSRRKLQRLASAAGLDHLPALQDEDQERVFDQYLQKVRQQLELSRPVAGGFPVNRNWLHVKGENAAGSVIAFNGGGGHFGIPIELFDHYLASLNLDVVYFRDNTRQFFFDGVEGLGSSIDAIIDKIQQLELPKPIYCISNSGGSFAALNYGLRVPVDGMILFAPFTYLASDFSKIKDYNPKFKIIADYLHRTYPDGIFDYQAAYSNQPRSFPVHFYYGDKDLTCRRHVSRMAKIPNMHSHEISGANHLVVRYLTLRNELLPILESHLRSTAASSLQ